MQKKPFILCYHRVAYPNSSDNSLLCVTPENFKEHLSELRKNYEFLSLEHLEVSRRSNSIAVTFDDGSKDWIKYAAPILEELKIPATFFISTRYIETEQIFFPLSLSRVVNSVNVGEVAKLLSFPRTEFSKNAYFDILEFLKSLKVNDLWNRVEKLTHFTLERELNSEFELPLNWSDVRMLSNSDLFSIGSHSSTHAKIANLSDEAFLAEIKESINSFKVNNLPFIDYFPIPFGQNSDFTQNQIRILSELFGLKSMSTLPLALGNNELNPIPRISVQNWEISYLNKVILYSQILSRAPKLLEPSMKLRRHVVKILN